MTHRWTGQVIETIDGLPYIGETAERQFVATGFSGNGMTFGTLAGMMARDAVLGRPNPWKELFDTGRTKIKGGVWDYLKENVDYPYYLLRDAIVGPQAKTLRGIGRGTGKIVDLKGQRMAAYRSDSGRLTLLSAVCTHMGCILNYSKFRNQFECPCHGATFETTGRPTDQYDTPLPTLPSLQVRIERGQVEVYSV